jgi:Spy/CpxP family protein refolding chaperone
MARKPMVCLLVLALVVGVAGVAFAGARGMGLGHGMLSPEAVGTRVEAIKSLGLTDEQVNQIQAMLQANYAANQQWRAQLAQKSLELRQLMWQKNPDQAAIDAKLAEINALREQFQEQRQTQQTLEDILTPEQLEQWRESAGGCGNGKRAVAKRAMGRMMRGNGSQGPR